MGYDPLDLVNLKRLMKKTEGIPEITIGMIDGPINQDHPSLKELQIIYNPNSKINGCKRLNSLACIHGTFIASILCGKRGSSSPSIAPKCKLVVNPIFSEDTGMIPTSTHKDLAQSIIEMVNLGTKIINLSLGLSSSSIVKHNELEDAYNYALKKSTIIISATGNQGNIGYSSILKHKWIIPVVACNEIGRFASISNLSLSIARRGLMAPGINITGAVPDGNYKNKSGTSFAAPFVSGAVALLWSLFPEAKPQEIIHSLIPTYTHTKGIIPPLFNAENSYEKLVTMNKN